MIQSLQRGLNILEIVAKSPAGMTLGEISRDVGLHSSTAFHLLRTLTTLGYLAQDPTTKRYHLGLKSFQLAASSWTEAQLFGIATPFLAEMAQRTGETSHLAVMEKGEVIIINRVGGTSPVVLAERVGYPRPAHSTAIGKVLLAYLPEPQLRGFLEKAELRRFTARTITAVSLLEEELMRVRRRGYAIDDEEDHQGIRCLAAPVWNFTGQVVAAIGMSGPVWSVTLDRVAPLIEIVNEGASALSKKLGYPGGEGTQGPALTPVGLGSGGKPQPIAMQEFLG
jgi:DNA-binding IclR family transcriptional regulator